jgi:hypothetical protein
MGQNINAQIDNESEYALAVKRLFTKFILIIGIRKNEYLKKLKINIRIKEIIFERWINPLYWNDFLFSKTSLGIEHQKTLEVLISFTNKVIRERENELKKCNFNLSSQKRIAFLDMFLKAKSEDPTLTYQDVQEEVDTFMFEGLVLKFF